MPVPVPNQSWRYMFMHPSTEERLQFTVQYLPHFRMLVVPGHAIIVVTILVFQYKILFGFSHLHYRSERNRRTDHIYFVYTVNIPYKESIQTDCNSTSRNKFQFIFSGLLSIIRNWQEREFPRTFQFYRLFHQSFQTQYGTLPFLHLKPETYRPVFLPRKNVYQITQPVTFIPAEPSSQYGTIEWWNTALLIPLPSVIHQFVLRGFTGRFILNIVNGIIPLQAGRIRNRYLRICLRIIYIRHLIQYQILRHTRIVDAMYPDQRTVIIQYVIGDIRINPVFPLQFIAVSDAGHLRIYFPRIVGWFEQDMRHQLTVPVIPGHHREVKTYPFTHIRYVRDTGITFRVRPPCMQWCYIMAIARRRQRKNSSCTAKGHNYGQKCHQVSFHLLL